MRPNRSTGRGFGPLLFVVLFFRVATGAHGAELALNGRVYARGEVDERGEGNRNLSVPSARLKLLGETTYADAELSVDVADRSMLKDAYVRLHDAGDRFRLAMGRFKAPFFARALESSWDLPLIRRGPTDDFLTERHQLGGRRLGLMAQAKLPARVRLWLGVFEGARDELGLREGEDGAARVAWKVGESVELGASGYLAAMGLIARAASADAALRLGGLGVSAEGAVGRLPSGTFSAGLLLVTYAVPLGEGGAWAVQALASAEALRLLGALGGQAWAATFGVNATWSDRVRVQLQHERALLAKDRAPAGRWLAQVGARL